MKSLFRWVPCALALGCAADPPGAPSAVIGASVGDGTVSSPAADAVGTEDSSGVSGTSAPEQPLVTGLAPAEPAQGSDPSVAAPALADASAPAADAQAPAPPPPTELNLPPGVVSRFPSAGASVCRDAPLRLSFGTDVRLGTTGKISVFNSTAPNVVVDSIDMAVARVTDTIAGRVTNLVRPVFLDGRDAVAYLHRAALQPNASYFVQVDPGVFLDANGKPLGSIADASWSFRTAAAPQRSASLVVQREGAGDFCTLQSALDAVPAGNTTPVTIELRNGIYHEIGYVTGKSNLTLHGEDRDATIIAYPNNENLNGGTAGRAMLTALNTNGLVIDNLTLHDTTPQDGGQAEALRVRADQVTLRNANFLSLQDTLLLEGHVYVADSYVEGNVDYVWGVGVAYFERSEIKFVGRSGVIVQARNGAGAFGYVFVDSRLTSDPNITNSTLARIDATVYPSSQVAYINCQIGPHISPAGWTVTPAGTTAIGALRFWEFQNTDLNGQPLNVSQRHPASRQIRSDEAAALRDRTAVLGWDPTK